MPTAADEHGKTLVNVYEQEQLVTMQSHYVPTRPKTTQYIAANIGKGMDANTAPNFPAGSTRPYKQNCLLFSIAYC